ncbi:MAG: hypothetical protein IKO23_08355 [Bacteroidales bacterium]|nr:hypothetical protein [Bacteroidales bacterium]
MKKLFLVLALAFAGIFTANAQVWIGGSTSVFANKNHVTFSITPEVGYSFPNTKWTVAIGADYGLKSTRQADNTFKTTHNLLLSPYVRYSICTIEKFGMFLDLTGDFDVLSDNFGYRVALQPGIAWMATKHWTAAFRFGILGYNHCDYFLNPNGTTPADTEYGFHFGFAAAAPSFGLYYNF